MSFSNQGSGRFLSSAVAIALAVLAIVAGADVGKQDQPVPVDLLKMVDPAKDAINGTWTMDNGALTTTAEGLANLEFQCAPSSEYDYRVVFEVKAQKDALMLICCGNGHQFAWVLNENSCGFSSVNGKGAAAKGNATVNRNTHLVIGKKYTTVVKVRNDGISAYLDDVLVSALTTDFSNLNLLKAHKLRRKDTIGLSTNRDAVRFESVEVIQTSTNGPTGARIAASTMPANAAGDVSPQDITDYRQQKLKPVLDRIQSLEPLIAQLPKGPNRPVSDLETRLADAKADQAKILAQSDDSLASEIRETRAIAAAHARQQRIASEQQRGLRISRAQNAAVQPSDSQELLVNVLCPKCGGTGTKSEQEMQNELSANAASLAGTGTFVTKVNRNLTCPECKGKGIIKISKAQYEQELALPQRQVGDGFCKVLLDRGEIKSAKFVSYFHGLRYQRTPLDGDEMCVRYIFTFVTEAGTERTNANGYVVIHRTDGQWTARVVNIDGINDVNIN